MPGRSAWNNHRKHSETLLASFRNRLRCSQAVAASASVMPANRCVQIEGKLCCEECTNSARSHPCVLSHCPHYHPPLWLPAATVGAEGCGMGRSTRTIGGNPVGLVTQPLRSLYNRAPRVFASSVAWCVCKHARHCCRAHANVLSDVRKRRLSSRIHQIFL